MGNKAKQRFLDLDVNEVSIVDSPANESEFVVIKNLTTQEVGEMADNMKKNEDVQDEASVEKVSVEVQKTNDEAINGAMKQVTAMIEGISKAVEAAASQNKEKPVEKSDDNSGGNSDSEASNKNDSGDSAESNSVQKGDSDSKNDENDVDDSAVEKTLTALGEAVEKARRFTPKREAAFKAALSALMELAKEMKITEIPVGTSPPVNTPKGASYGASSVPIAKSVNSDNKLEEFFTNTQKALDGLLERVEQIEKARMPSNSVEGDGGTDVKTSKSFWRGVI